MRVSILLWIAVAASIAGCARKPEPVAADSRLASELKLLDRQTSALKEAIADARRGELFPPGDIAVGVSEEVIQSTLAQALPLEQPVAQSFRARIDRATVSFRSMQGSVTLEGRIWALAEPGTFADLVLLGGIRDVEVERETGVLRAGIVLDGWEVKRAATMGEESELVEALVRLLGDRGLSALRDLVPAVRIPVGIENGVDLPGASGPFTTISVPGSLPFRSGSAAASTLRPRARSYSWFRSSLPSTSPSGSSHHNRPGTSSRRSWRAGTAYANPRCGRRTWSRG